LTRGPDVAVKLWIDDLEVRFVDLSRMGEDRAKLVFRPLFRDNFNRYESDLFPGGGWLQGPGRFAGEAGSPGREAEEDGRVRRKAAVVDDRVYASSSRSFKLEGSEEEPGTVMKRFSLPDRVPFAVSAETFVIVGPGEEGRVERGSLAGSWGVSGEDGRLRKRRESEEVDRERNRPALNQRSDRPRREASSVKLGIESAAGSERMMSGPFPSGTFYIYSFDGRLLAEYDVLGNWVKDYIYFGGQLVAEYRNGALYYYASDQIRSTRIVTDSSGNVVYSAAHEPYGGIQQTWVTNYDPELKFSGKPHDAESGLDYFGARYYDHSLYRFLSVDPVIPVGRAVSNSQRWNLYGYCLGNPVRYVDWDGRQATEAITIEIMRYQYGTDATHGIYRIELGEEVIYGYTLEPALNVGKGPIPTGTYDAEFYWWSKKGYWVYWLQDVEGFKGIFVHRGNIPGHTKGCILVGKTRTSEGIGDSKIALNEIMYEIAEFHAGLIQGQIQNGLDDLEYMSRLCRGRIRVRLLDIELPEGEVTYWVYVH
jgi:RHS repeat-associated protein